MKKMNLLVIGCLSLIGCSATLSVFALTDAPTDTISVNLQPDAYSSLKDMQNKRGPIYPESSGAKMSLPRTGGTYPSIKIPFSATITDNIPLDIFYVPDPYQMNFISYWGVNPRDVSKEITFAPTGLCDTHIVPLKSGDTLQITKFYAPPTRGVFGGYDCSIA